MRIDKNIYTIRVDIDNITYPKYCTIEAWCEKNLASHYSNYQDWDRIMDAWWYFANEDDATHFKLVWL